MALPCGMVYVALFGAIAMQSESLGFVYDPIWVRNRS
jgi:sulfite exporter TauE/SafE